jgi:G3E family GTPase
MVMDHLFTLNESTPKLRAQGRRGVPPSLVFGLDSKLYLGGANEKELEIEGNHHDEVETVTISRGRTRQNSNHSHEHDHEHSLNNIALNDDRSPPIPLTPSLLDTALASAPKDFIYRIKGYVTFSDGRRVILNWAFGRYDLTELGADKNDRDNGDLRLSVMGENGEVRRWASRWALENFGITI